MNNKNEQEGKNHYLPIFMSIGLSVGVAIGAAINNMPLAMAVGFYSNEMSKYRAKCNVLLRFASDSCITNKM